MSGHCIESEDFVIVVDKWDASFLRRPGCKPHYFFLTHLHADHIKGLTSTWSRIIYTSPFNAWLLPMRRNVKPMLLKEVELNVTLTIRKSNNEIAFQVTLLDANHCPGAVMFLFQGKFGNVLYTGDFRYSRKILNNPVLSPIIRNKELSTLYLDNTYAAPTCKFPSREDALKEVLKIVDNHPDCKILIGMRQLGKEEVLRAVALHLNEKVCVSTQRLQILSKLEYEDVFTTDITQSRIHAVELHTITQRHSQEGSKVVSIKLTSMYECGNTERQRGNIYVVPYSDHSSHTELTEFVDHLRPLKLYPIVLPKVPKMTGEAGPWYRMSSVNCVIPEEILQLCGPAAHAASLSSTQASENGSPLSLKFHPAPKMVDTEKMSNSATCIDEGMNLVPFDSLESHLTNNNKARKHIKASWTRLAPKILSQKGIQFKDASPVKSPDQSLAQVECSSDVIGFKRKGDNVHVPVVPSSVNNDDHLSDVPLSDGDDELDMPSSASELAGRMQLPCGTSNGVGSEDRKSECSSELTVISVQTEIVDDPSTGVRRTRSKEKLESPTQPASKTAGSDSKDSSLDAFSVRRSTRSKGSVSSMSVVSRPKTRLSLGSHVDVHGERTSQKKQIPVRKSPRDISSAQEVLVESPSSTSSEKNGLSKRSISLENLSVLSPPKEIITKRVTRGSKEDLSKVVESKGSPNLMLVERMINSEDLDLDLIEIPNAPGEQKKTTKESERKEGTRPNSPKTTEVSISAVSNLTLDNISAQSSDVNKKSRLNGSHLKNNFNGIHINSPGRKRVPLSCDWDAAQEIAKKETEQALKALETLNEMKGFKTRNVGNRSGIVALRRLSADNIPTKPPVKNQNLIVSPVSPTGLRRRTASILSSMASTFSKPSPKKQAGEVNSSTASSTSDPVTELSPISPVKEVKKTPQKKGSSTAVITAMKKAPSTSPIKETRASGLSSPIANKKEMSTLPVTETRASRSTSPLKEKRTSDVNLEGHKEASKLEDSMTKNETDHSLKSDLTSSGKEKQQEQKSSSESEVDKGEKTSSVKMSASTSSKISESCNKSSQISESTGDSEKDALNQGLFLTNETLASTSSSGRSTSKISQRRSFFKRQNDLNVDLIRLKVGFAMTSKGPKRLSLPSRLSLNGKETATRIGHGSPALQSKEKVQDWKKKLTLHLRRSPQRRYRYKSPTKLRESAKRTLATILRSGRSLNNSQGYHGDVEDCTELSQKSGKDTSDIEETSGHRIDDENQKPDDEVALCKPLQSSQSSQESIMPLSSEASSRSVISDSLASVDLKDGVFRRSSRLQKEEGTNMLGTTSSKAKSPLNPNSANKKSVEPNAKPMKDLVVNLNPPLMEVTAELSPIQNPSDTPASPVVCLPSPTSFSERISEKSRMLFNKSADKVLAHKSPNLLTLMADAFKKSVPFQTSSTANILSSMAENFKKLDEGAQVSPSLSIQLISTKSQRPTSKEKNPNDWGVQITRVDNAPSKQKLPSPYAALDGLPSTIPKSLSIEIIPDDEPTKPVPRKGPSPPTITICPEVIDLMPDGPEAATHSATRTLPVTPGPRPLPKGASRWTPIMKPDIIQSPPPAVWKEKRGSKQSGDKVIINIETQEDPQKVPHCPVHCTCGAASRQGTCMGTMRNLIEADADCLYEVPLSPEDMEDAGAMLALGRGWIESCFEDVEDRDEFFETYDDILPTVSSIKQKKSKPAPANINVKSQVKSAPQPHVRRVLSAPKKSSPSVRQTSTSASVSNIRRNSSSSNSSASVSAKKQTPSTSRSNVQVQSQSSKCKEDPKKRLSTESEPSTSLLKDIQKKMKSFTDEPLRRQSAGSVVPSRRSSSHSSSSTSSVAKYRSSKRSLSPAPPPPLPPSKRKSLDVELKKEKISDQNLKRKKSNTSGSSSGSPESKKVKGSQELKRLTDMTGKSGLNQRYRLSVRRSLDHLMTRQKLRSDRRVKTSSSSHS